jgi:hypothetical protein
MATDRRDDQRPERPRSEPEIIPAGCDPQPPRGPMGVWMRVDRHDGVHRIYVAQPGPGTIIFGLLLLSTLAAIAFLALAGFLLFWIPIVLAGILLALGAAALRHRWNRLRAWWARVAGRIGLFPASDQATQAARLPRVNAARPPCTRCWPLRDRARARSGGASRR